MVIEPHILGDFRARLTEALAARRDEWQDSRQFLTTDAFGATLGRLIDAIKTSSLPGPLQDALAGVLRRGAASRVQELDGPGLKALTGLPPTKAVRALCLLFGLGDRPAEPDSGWPPDRIESYVRSHANPYDLLLETIEPSILELGAGDLSFAASLADEYLPPLERIGRGLTFHTVDRLRPGSHVGGRYHADAQRLARLNAHPSGNLRFRFWGGQDMFEVGALRGTLRNYTIVTCQAPPNPTVAYEPTRLSAGFLREHLRRTKGEFRVIREEQEEVLEVRHSGRALLFPPWKFEVRGPAALLDLMSQLGRLCVLSAVDTEVFWELLSQLPADPGARPPDEIFTPDVLVRALGDLATKLNALPVGQALVLSEHIRLRDEIPRVLDRGVRRRYRFRYIEVRRGALFPGLPASQTAKQFPTMTEEAPPWFLILVPEEVGAA